MKIIAPDASSVLGLTYLSPSGMYVVTLVETAISLLMNITAWVTYLSTN